MASHGPFFKLPRNCLDFEHNLTCAFLQKKKRKTIGQSCFLLLITSERPKRDVAAPFGKQRNWRKAYFLALTVLSLSGGNR